MRRPADATAAVAEGGAFHRPLVPRHRRRRGPGRGARPEHRRHHERPALGVRHGRRRLLPHRRDRLPDPGVLSPGGPPRPGGPRHGDRRHRRAERDVAGLQEAEDRPRLGLRLPPPLLHQYARHHADRLRPAGRDRHGRGHRRPHQQPRPPGRPGRDGPSPLPEDGPDPHAPRRVLPRPADRHDPRARRDRRGQGLPADHARAPAARRPARPRTTPASTSPRTAPSGSSSSSPAAGPTARPSSRTASSRSAPAGTAVTPSLSPSRRRSPPSSPPPSAAAAGRRTCWISSAPAETARRCGMRGCG